MDNGKLIRDFYNSFFEMEYEEALQTVGVMKEKDKAGARYYEMLILYELGRYDKVRNSLQDQQLSISERELYIGSLTELRLFEELQQELKNPEPISEYCFYYINGLLTKMGRQSTGEHNVVILEDTYFENKYKWFICNEIASVYRINEEIIEMTEARMGKAAISSLEKKLNEKCRSIRISDPWFDEIKDACKTHNHIGIEKVLWFPIRYLGDTEKDGSPKMVHTFSTLYNILKYLNLCLEIGDKNTEYEMMVEYLPRELNQAVRKNNRYAINYFKQLYIRIANPDSSVVADDNKIANVVYSVLREKAPYVIDEINNHELDTKLDRALSTKGRFAYKAALWQFDNTVSGDYGTLDAGMLCLSYMRILELELNEKVITPLRKKHEVIENRYISMKEARAELDDKWNDIIGSLNTKNDGLELGPTYNLLSALKIGNFKEKSDNEKMADFIREQCEDILSDKGMNALKSGNLSKMIKPKVREKYRNPPAHTRYVSIGTALECKNYVENNLVILSEYVS